MAIITVNQFNDDGVTARTPGEVLTVNGATFTQRTDTRWHATAPASMTGTYGGNSVISSTLGGKIIIEGRNVRWMEFNTGTGTVPAIGTTITQGGVSGYLLAVYTNLTSAPTAVGAAMPTSGFIKFREVTGGTFAAGALTGISASAVGPDVVGWLEIVVDEAGNFNVPRLGSFETYGDWFQLGTTNGTVGQVFQVPTNGGGANTICPGLWIETGVGTNQYEYWAGARTSTNQWTVISAGLPRGSTSELQKLVLSSTNGQLVIGENVNQSATYTWAANVVTVTLTAHGYSVGNQVRLNFTSGGAIASTGTYRIRTAAANTFTVDLTGSGTAGNVTIEMTIGSVPTSGRRVRIPNVFLRACTTAARATNVTPNATIATRPDFTTTSAGSLVINNTYGDWYFLTSGAYSVSLNNVATFDQVSFSNTAATTNLTNVGMSGSIGLTTQSVIITSCLGGGTISNCSFIRTGASSATGHIINFSLSSNFTVSNCTLVNLAYARNTGARNVLVSLSNDITLNNITTINGQFGVDQSKNVFINNTTYIDRYVGFTNPTGAQSILSVTGRSDNVVLDGTTWATDNNPYTSILAVTNSINIKTINIGTRGTPLAGNSLVDGRMGNIFTSGGNNVNVVLRRVYTSLLRTSPVTTINTDNDFEFTNVATDAAPYTWTIASNTSKVKGCLGINTVTGQASVYDTHWMEVFESNTVGRIVLIFNEPTVVSSQFTITNGTPQFTSTGNLAMPTLGQQVIWEMPFFAKGHTAFANTAPTITGTNTGNMSYEYQIDTGNGFNTTWRTLNGTNLSAETINASTGFKLRIRITTITANTGNLLTYLRINTVSTLVAQTDNLYPIEDEKTLTLTNISTGSDVVITPEDSSTVLSREDHVLSSTYTFKYNLTEPVDIGIFKSGFIPYKIKGYDLPNTNSSLIINQTPDRNYSNVDPFSNLKRDALVFLTSNEKTYSDTTGLTPASANGTVANWTVSGSMGMSLTQSTAGSRPTLRPSNFNKRSSIEFNTDFIFGSTATPYTDGIVMYLAFNMPTNVNADYDSLLALVNTTLSPADIRRLEVTGWSTGGNLGKLTHWYSGGTNTVDRPLTPQIYQIIIAPGQDTNIINSTGSITSTTITASSFSFNGICLGANWTDASGPGVAPLANAFIAGLGIYPYTILNTAPKREVMMNYWKDLYQF